MLLATYRSDGRPLDLADIATFIASLAEAGIPANTPLVFEVIPDDNDDVSPAIGISAPITFEQSHALPETLEFRYRSEITSLQEV